MRGDTAKPSNFKLRHYLLFAKVDIIIRFDKNLCLVFGGKKVGNLLKFAGLVILPVAATGANSPAPTATVTVVKGYDKGSGLDGTGTAQFYDVSDANQCKARKRITKFSWITGAEKSKPIPAGKIVYLTAYTKRYTPGGGWRA